VKVVGKGRVAVSWAPPPARSRVTSAVIRIEEYRPSTHHWRLKAKRTVSASKRLATFTGLRSRHRYRIAVSFRNQVGMGLASRWRLIVAS
jgi:hypothetical protein